MKGYDELEGWESPSTPLDFEAVTRPRIVVFDLDGVLCATPMRPVPEGAAPEAMRVEFRHKGETYTHFIIPHVDLLLAHLVAWGCRVCFFSSAIPERNHAVMAEVLSRSFDASELSRLTALGQFDILSRGDLRDGDREAGETGNKIKDMRRVVRGGEALEDAVLIEDQPSFAALGQWPCLRALDVELWRPADPPGRFGWNDGEEAYKKNGAAWILGVFDLLLHDVRYRYSPLRVGLDRLLFDLYGATRRDSSWGPPIAQSGVILRGLDHIWRVRPEAIFFGRPSRSLDD